MSWSKIYKQIPNLFTIFNLSSGFLGILFLFNRNLEAAAYCIIAGAVFDFFDGFAARMLKATSPEGKVLDSLADIITFSVLPAAMVFCMIESSLSQPGTGFDFNDTSILQRIYLFSPVMIVIASAIRLADFTVRDSSRTFSGMPTPSSALLITGIALVTADPGQSIVAARLLKIYIILPSMLIISWLMVSRIHFMSLKFSSLRIREYLFEALLIIFSLLLLIFLRKFAISLIILLYILLSLIKNFVSKPIDL